MDQVICALLEMQEIPTARLMKMMNLVFDLRGKRWAGRGSSGGPEVAGTQL